MNALARAVSCAALAALAWWGCATVDSNKAEDRGVADADGDGAGPLAAPIGGAVLEPVDVRAENEERLTVEWAFDGAADGFVVRRTIGDGPDEVVGETDAQARSIELAFSACEGVLRFDVEGLRDGDVVYRGTSDVVDYCDMALVPAGHSWVGCDDAVDPLCYPEEKPIHEVRLSTFWIDRTEVSFARYDECVASGTCLASRLESSYRGIDGRNPVVGVNWPMARTYCAWRGKRLPTEAEWEKAARGDTRHIYPWGDEWAPTLANWDDQGRYDGYAGLAPVDSFAEVPSPSGAHNMTGNVWEWVSDYYGPDYYAVSPSWDPQGPETGDQRLTKGGAWKYDFYETRLRVTHRNPSPESGSSNHVGFRCARR